MKAWRSFFIILFSLAVAACVTIQGSSLGSSPDINTLVISNKTGSVITNVTLNVSDQQNRVYCNMILPNSQCSLGLQAIDAEKHPPVLVWSQESRQYSHEVSAGNSATTDNSSRVYVDLYDNGRLQAYFR